MIKRVQDDLKSALKSGDKQATSTLRMLLSSLKNAKIANANSLTDEQAVSVVKKEIKRRIEARDMYANNGRPEQASQEEYERQLLSQYAPAQLTQEQVDDLIISVAKTTTDMNFGSIMPKVMQAAKGNADGKMVADRLKNYLSKGE